MRSLHPDVLYIGTLYIGMFLCATALKSSFLFFIIYFLFFENTSFAANIAFKAAGKPP